MFILLVFFFKSFCGFVEIFMEYSFCVGTGFLDFVRNKKCKVLVLEVGIKWR